MKKTYDIRNIYVATIAKQSDVESTRHIEGKILTYYTDDWDYSDDKIGLFVKTIRGYKHILTGIIYDLASYKTGGEFVIIPEEIYEVCKYDINLAKHLVIKNNSYRLTLDQINHMEDRFNNELKCDDELNV